MTDSIWTYFSKEKGAEKAKCLKCQDKFLSCKGSSTSGLIRHLQHVHKINLSKRNANDDQFVGPSKIVKVQPQSIITFFNKKQSMAEIVARLATVDGFSIHGIAKSEFIRQSLNERQYNLPKGKSNVMKLIHDFYELKKSEIKQKIESYKETFGKFSITLDEWTSLRNRRYLNVNIHFNQKYINLGLVKIEGSCTANKTIELVNSKLSDFGINLSDVVASTTDGAAVMVKFGTLSQYIHQLCYNHGIHLAVIDVIYKKNENDNIDCQIESDIDEFSTITEDFSRSDSDEESNNDLTQRCERDDINCALQMVRKIGKFFKISPKRNSILQEHVKEQHMVEYSLLLDCKTRWNSIITMVERFLKIVESVRKALIDLGSVALLNDENIPILLNIFNALNPIKVAAEALNRRDANLVTADAIFKFLFDSLRANDDNLSIELLQVLSIRIKERRNQDLVSLTKYLKTLDLKSTATSELPSSSKATIIRYANETFNRLFGKEIESAEVEIQIQSEYSSDEKSILVPNSNINDILTGVINAALQIKKKVINSSLDEINLQKEFNLYENTGNITKNLKKLLDALMNIQPTSIECERIFSASSNFCNKKRSNLSDYSLNCLSFLKTYFLNKN